MFALARQVQIASDQAKNGSARLAGIEPPRYEDNETTIEQLKERLAKTVAFLKTLDPKAIDTSADREITFPLGPDNKGYMKGSDYLNHFVLPNFYFHLTAAYAILRQCGVDIGKRDFLGAIPMRGAETPCPARMPYTAARPPPSERKPQGCRDEAERSGQDEGGQIGRERASHASPLVLAPQMKKVLNRSPRTRACAVVERNFRLQRGRGQESELPAWSVGKTAAADA